MVLTASRSSGTSCNNVESSHSRGFRKQSYFRGRCKLTKWSMLPSWSKSSSFRAELCGGCSWRPRQQDPCRVHAHSRWFSARYQLSPVIGPSQSLEYKEQTRRGYLRVFVLDAQRRILFLVPSLTLADEEDLSTCAQMEWRDKLLVRHAVQVSAAHRRSARPHHSRLSLGRRRSEPRECKSISCREQSFWQPCRISPPLLVRAEQGGRVVPTRVYETGGGAE